MSYRFKTSDESLTAALRRVAAAEIAGALAHAPGAPGSVHDSRKRVKKVRALLRLVRPGFPGGREENAVLRDAAGGLSALRDAEVMLATHDKLNPDARDGAVRAHLVQQMERAKADPAQAGRGEAFRTVLGEVQGRIERWKVKGKDAEVLAEGLARTRDKAVKAMALARKTRDSEDMHEWRKRVKDGWYQARLFSPVWHPVMDRWETEANELGEILGDHHDLAVFSGVLDTMPEGAAAEVAELRTLVNRARGDLEIQALERGHILHAGDPEGVAGLWVDWWKAWRAG